jgi:peptidoglycan/xylan/chitin deacetylase (PgdA/CDA1 family)
MPYTDPQLLQELTVKAFQEVTVALGHTPDLLFQPPQLSADQKSINAILATGYQAVIGSRVSTHDYTRNAQQVLRFVKRYINNGAMVLIHSSDNASANEALPEIIEYARSQGFTFDRLGDYFPLKMQDGRAVPHAK